RGAHRSGARSCRRDVHWISEPRCHLLVVEGRAQLNQPLDRGPRPHSLVDRAPAGLSWPGTSTVTTWVSRPPAADLSAASPARTRREFIGGRPVPPPSRCDQLGSVWLGGQSVGVA